MSCLVPIHRLMLLELHLEGEIGGLVIIWYVSCYYIRGAVLLIGRDAER